MKQFTIGKNEDGKRLDAVASLIIPKAGKGFIYKMLRKKNIVLNEKKADGNERVKTGDVIKFYLSDETFEGFGGVVQSEGVELTGADETAGGTPDGTGKTLGRTSGSTGKTAGKTTGIIIGKTQDTAYSGFQKMIIYEDDDIMLIDKPAGMLSQKAEAADVSVNELMIGYLLEEGKISEEGLKTFKPSVCNRLDRNTSGMICAGISLKGTRELTRLIRDRLAGKYYLCIVCGEVARKKVHLRSYLRKDEKNNKVKVSNTGFEGSVPVEIEYCAVKSQDGFSLLKVRLITGKSHQIRAQLASAGFPIAGDIKYGNRQANDMLKKKYRVNRQLLTAYSFVFPEETELENVRGREFHAELPEDFFIHP